MYRQQSLYKVKVQLYGGSGARQRFTIWLRSGNYLTIVLVPERLLRLDAAHHVEDEATALVAADVHAYLCEQRQ